MKIDVTKDWEHAFECGCKFVWLGTALHKSVRFDPCLQHRGPGDRGRLGKIATGHYELANAGHRTTYQDVGDVPEDDRIKKIGESAQMGGVVGFIVEDEPGKAERYAEKLVARFPNLRILEKIPGPTPGTVLVKISMRQSRDLLEREMFAQANRLHHLTMVYAGSIAELAEGKPLGLIPRDRPGIDTVRDLASLVLIMRAEINALMRIVAEKGLIQSDDVIAMITDEYKAFCDVKCTQFGCDSTVAGLVFKGQKK